MTGAEIFALLSVALTAAIVLTVIATRPEKLMKSMKRSGELEVEVYAASIPALGVSFEQVDIAARNAARAMHGMSHALDSHTGVRPDPEPDYEEARKAIAGLRDAGGHDLTGYEHIVADFNAPVTPSSGTTAWASRHQGKSIASAIDAMRAGGLSIDAFAETPHLPNMQGRPIGYTIFVTSTKEIWIHDGFGGLQNMGPLNTPGPLGPTGPTGTAAPSGHA